MKRILALPDIHSPDNINLGSVEKLMVDFKPTHVIYLGDLLDFCYIGKFAEGNSLGQEGKRIKKDYDVVRKLVGKHRRLCPHAQLIYMLGNHELRINYEIEHNPKLEGLIGIEENIGNSFDKIYTYGEIWEASKYLGYMHGVYCNLHHAKKTSQEFGEMTIIYCHCHDRQLYTRMNMRDRKPKPRYAQSIGCLCNLSPEYLRKRGRINKWVHAFSIAYVWDNGYFNEYTIHVINGKFVYGGKSYR